MSKRATIRSIRLAKQKFVKRGKDFTIKNKVIIKRNKKGILKLRAIKNKVIATIISKDPRILTSIKIKRLLNL